MYLTASSALAESLAVKERVSAVKILRRRGLVHTFQLNKNLEGGFIIWRLLPYVSREDRVCIMEDISLFQFLPHHIAHFINFVGCGSAKCLRMSRSIQGKKGENSRGRSRRGDERAIHSDGDILVLQSGKEEVQVIHLFDLGHKLDEVGSESPRIMVIENVQIDSVPSTSEEGSAVF